MKNSTNLIKVKRSVANEFMSKYEHLGNLGLGVWHYGLEYSSQIIGVVSYGTACFSYKRSWIGKIACQCGASVVQLCRGGSITWAPKNTASYLVSRANKGMFNEKGPLLIVAYSTPEIGEVGTIYQACNAVYVGMTNPKGQSNYSINGKLLSGWQVRKRYGTRDRLKLADIVDEVEVLPLSPRHCYVFPCGSKLQKKRLIRHLNPYSKPYPKRVENLVPSMAGLPGIPERRDCYFKGKQKD